MRRVRHGSPEGKMGRLNLKGEESGLEFVNRRPDGSFLLGVAGFGETVAVPQFSLPRTAEEVEQGGESKSRRGGVSLGVGLMVW